MSKLEELRSCDQCGKGFPPVPWAPHKRFCSESCRNTWHSELRREAKALLAKAKEASTQQD